MEPRAASIAANHEGLRRACMALMRDPVEAEDLAQQVIVEALTSRSFDPSRPMGPWLKGVARNMAASSWRRGERVQPTDNLPEGATPARQDEVSSVAREAASAWSVVVGALDGRSRSVLLLRDMLDLSVRETAELLGMSPGNVKVVLHRARARLATASRDRSLQARQERQLLTLLTGGELDRVAPSQLFGDTQEFRPELETQNAWELWHSLLDAAIRATSVLPELGIRARMVRLITLRDVPGYDVDADIAGAEALLDASTSAEVEAEFRLVCAVAWMRLGRVQEARAALERAELLNHTGPLRSNVLSVLAGIHWRRGAFAESLARYAEAREHATPEQTRSLLHNEALVRALMGDLDAARSEARQAIEAHRQAGRLVDEAHSHNALAMALQNHGQLVEAEESFRRATACMVGVHGERNYDAIENNLGLLEHEQGKLVEARQRFEAVLQRSLDNGNVRREAIVRANLGVTLRELGELRASLDALARARVLAEELTMVHLAGFVGSHLALGHALLLQPAAAALERARVDVEEAGDERLHDLWRLAEAGVDFLEGRGGLDEVVGSLEARWNTWVATRIMRDAVLSAARRRAAETVGSPSPRRG